MLLGPSDYLLQGSQMRHNGLPFGHACGTYGHGHLAGKTGEKKNILVFTKGPFDLRSQIGTN